MMTVERYAGSPSDWDSFVESSNEGTLYHQFRFLAYHGDRFSDCERPLVILRDGTMFGVMPFAVVSGFGRSPYGGTFGGPVFAHPLGYTESGDVADALMATFRTECDRVLITLPIQPCHRIYSDTFRLALHERGFTLRNRDVSSVVDIEGPVLQSRRPELARRVRRASSAGVTVKRSASWDDLYPMVVDTLRAHGAEPTHTLAELQLLDELLPGRFWATVAYLAGRPVYGVGAAQVSDRLIRTMYIASDRENAKFQSASAAMSDVLEEAAARKVRYIDFGLSSDDGQGWGSVFAFKESFGAVGIFRDDLELDLRLDLGL